VLDPQFGKKLAKENTRTIGENSPNLVTLQARCFCALLALF
jgi:hypothetical protein